MLTLDSPAIYQLRASNDVGGAEVEIVELIPGERIVLHWQFVGPEATIEDVDRVIWICEGRFPPPPGDQAYAITPEQVAWFEQFLRERYVPCLAAQGYRTIGLEPDAELVTFGDGPVFSSWIPFPEALVPVPDGMAWGDLQRACPLPEFIDAYVP